MKTLRPLLYIAIACHTAALAQPSSGWQASKAQALEAFNQGNCAKAWQLVWPWAQNGNAQALAVLATGVPAAGLLPPGAPQDGLARVRHMLILSAHGAAADDAANTELLNSLLQDPTIADAGGRQLRQCLAAKTPVTACLTQAVASGFLPSLASYAKELALAEKQPNALASCNIPPRLTPMPK